MQTLIGELEEAYNELSEFTMCDDGFEQFEVAQTVEELNHKAAKYGIPIESRPVMLAPREALIRIGKLLAWARQQTDLQALHQVLETVKRLESRQTVKEWYTTEEVASLTDYSEFIIREGCRTKRFPDEWYEKQRNNQRRITHKAVDHIRNHGLPPKK